MTIRTTQPEINLRETTAVNANDPTPALETLYVQESVVFANLPSADPLIQGQLWSNLGIVTVSSG